MKLNLKELKDQILQLDEVKEINDLYRKDLSLSEEAVARGEHFVITAKKEILPDEVDDWVSLLDTLPQKAFLSHEAVLNWFKRTLLIDRERLRWHIIRTGGFGGSEMGGLVDSMHGIKNFRNTAYSLISGKLFLRTPSKSEPAMERGNIMEDFAQLRFEDKLNKLGYRWERLDYIKKHVIEDKSNEQYPSIRSSLDGLYKVNGETWIVDFKCPSTDVMREYKGIGEKLNFKSKALKYSTFSQFFVPNSENRKRISFSSHLPFEDYIYQLHHYLVDAECKDVKIDRTVLAVFDYQEGADSVLIEIERDEAIIKDIIDASSYFWEQYVLKGQIPPPDNNEYFEAQNVPEDIQICIEEFTDLKLLISEFTKRADEVRKEIEVWVKNNTKLSDSILKLDSLEVKAKLEFNSEQVEHRLLELGFNNEEIDLMRDAGTFDTKSLKEYFFDVVSASNLFFDGMENKDKEKMISAVTELKRIRDLVPEKKKGNFNEEKVEQAFLSCNEDPICYKSEVLSTGLTRKKDIDLDLKRENISEMLNNILDMVSHRQGQEHVLTHNV